MPTYDYMCDKCGEVFEKTYSMSEKPNSIKCEKCDGDCIQTLINTKLQTWVRGDGIVKDKGGARRDMNLYKLQHEDPYSQHRVGGEKSYLEDKFRRGGKLPHSPDHNPKWGTNENGEIVPLNEAARLYDEKKSHLK